MEFRLFDERETSSLRKIHLNRFIKPFLTNLPFNGPLLISDLFLPTNLPFNRPLHISDLFLLTNLPFNRSLHISDLFLLTNLSCNRPLHISNLFLLTNLPINRPLHIFDLFPYAPQSGLVSKIVECLVSLVFDLSINKVMKIFKFMSKELQKSIY